MRRRTIRLDCDPQHLPLKIEYQALVRQRSNAYDAVEQSGPVQHLRQQAEPDAADDVPARSGEYQPALEKLPAERAELRTQIFIGFAGLLQKLRQPRSGVGDAGAGVDDDVLQLPPQEDLPESAAEIEPAEASAEYLFPKEGYDIIIDTGTLPVSENAMTVFEKIFGE